MLSKALSTENPLILLGTLFKQTKRSRPSYQQAHIKIPEIGENGECIHNILEDGKPLREYVLLINAQLRAALWARGILGIGKKEKMINLSLMAEVVNLRSVREGRKW